MDQNEDTGYFVTRREISKNYTEMVASVNETEYENIGLLTGSDSYEYPLIELLDKKARIEHIRVDNVTAKYEDKTFVPDIIVVLDYDVERDGIEHGGYVYEVLESFGGDNLIMVKKYPVGGKS